MKWLVRTLFVWLFFCTFSLVAFLLASNIKAVEVKPYVGHVNDFAQVLSAETITAVEQKLLTQSQQPEGVEVAVITLDSLEGEVIETVSLAYFDQWQIGKKGADNGVLLLLAINDREIRIQTGYGVEGSLPDGLAGRIIRNDIIPHLAENNYDAAVTVGVERILQSIASPQDISSNISSNQMASPWTVLLIMFIFFGGIVLFVLLIAKLAAKSGPGKPGKPRSNTFPRSTRSSSSSSSSFSFGGGRTGGGGASGKW